MAMPKGSHHTEAARQRISESLKRSYHERYGDQIVDGKKRCSACGEWLSISSFHADRDKKTGLHTMCKKCRSRYGKANIEHKREYLRDWCHRKGITRSMAENKSCSAYLGIHIAEKVLSKIFPNVKQMPHNNPGYDFICGKGFKIDVKAATRSHPKKSNDCWIFRVCQNKTADYFLCLAFDNRKALNPEHVWLIPGHVVNFHKHGFAITTTRLEKWAEYEKSLDKVSECCNLLKGDEHA